MEKMNFNRWALVITAVPTTLTSRLRMSAVIHNDKARARRNGYRIFISVNVLIRRTMHLSSVIHANDTRESMFGHQHLSRRERVSNLGPPATEASAQPLSYHAFAKLKYIVLSHVDIHKAR